MVKMLRMVRRHRSGLLKLSTLSVLAVVCLVIANPAPPTWILAAVDRQDPSPDVEPRATDVSGMPTAASNRSSRSDYAAMTTRTSSANPHPFRIVLEPIDLCSNVSSGSLLGIVYVHSRPYNAWIRDVIRRTWGNVTAFSGAVRLIFVLGVTPRQTHVQDQLRIEASRFNDILQEDFVDSYKNLTYKAIAALKWVTLNCARAHYVIKVDDDVMVDTFSLIRILRSLDSVRSSVPFTDGQHQIWCRVWTRMKVQRTGKWRVDPAEYSGGLYPPYCSGMAYIMTSEAARALYLTSYDAAFFWVDDVYVTGILAEKASIRLVNLQYLFVLQPDLLIREKAESGSHRYTPIFAHSSRVAINVPELWQRVLVLESRVTGGESPQGISYYSTTVFTGKVVASRSVSPNPLTNQATTYSNSRKAKYHLTAMT